MTVSQEWVVWLMWNEKEVHDWMLGQLCDLSSDLTNDTDLAFSRSNFAIPGAIFVEWEGQLTYRKVSNISRTLIGNKIVDHSDVVGASPVGAAPTTSS